MEMKILHVVLVINLVPILFVNAQNINRAPHFIPNSGDLSRFSLSENTPVGSPVYQLKGEIYFLKLVACSEIYGHPFFTNYLLFVYYYSL